MVKLQGNKGPTWTHHGQRDFFLVRISNSGWERWNMRRGNCVPGGACWWSCVVRIIIIHELLCYEYLTSEIEYHYYCWLFPLLLLWLFLRWLWFCYHCVCLCEQPAKDASNLVPLRRVNAAGGLHSKLCELHGKPWTWKSEGRFVERCRETLAGDPPSFFYSDFEVLWFWSCWGFRFSISWPTSSLPSYGLTETNCNPCCGWWFHLFWSNDPLLVSLAWNAGIPKPESHERNLLLVATSLSHDSCVLEWCSLMFISLSVSLRLSEGKR